MPQMTLEALNAKYPTCSTCQSRTMRKSGNGRKITQIAWCDRHHRPVEYHTYTDEKGGKWVHGDVPCEDYVYQRTGSLFLSRCTNRLPSGQST
jgi:hypothetical protein